MLRRFVIDRFHALLVEWTRILDLLAALAVGPAVQHAPRSEPLLECRVLRIVRVLWLFLGIEVVKIAEELVEPMHRWETLVLVPEVIFAKLPGGIAQGFQ